MENILAYGFPAVLIVMGLVQVVKMFVSSKWAVLFSLAFGVGLVSLANYATWTPEALVKGIVVGLCASGLFSGAKAVIKK